MKTIKDFAVLHQAVIMLTIKMTKLGYVGKIINKNDFEFYTKNPEIPKRIIKITARNDQLDFDIIEEIEGEQIDKIECSGIFDLLNKLDKLAIEIAKRAI